MLTVNNLSMSYGKNQIFSDLTFTIHSGEIVGLVGENGAGKSTLLRVLATLQKPKSGTVQLNNFTYLADKNKIRRLIGFVPQEIAIWDEFTVKENMLFFEKLSWKKRSESELRQFCLEMNLDQWNKPVKTLSGGMKRKLNMAISLIHDPYLILLDEPTVGIDLKSKKEIKNYLHDLANNKGKVIVYTSHDMDEINTLCSRVLCIGNDPFYKDILKKAGKNIHVF